MRSEFQKAFDWWVEDDSETGPGQEVAEGAHGHVPVKADRAFTWGDGDED